jgi:predicted RecA/RadA family phage recombinase
MRNFVQDGNVLTLVVPQGGVLSGHPIIVGSIFGIAAHDALEYAEVEAHVVGVFELPKGSGQIDQGGIAYWDDALGVVKAVSAPGLFAIGVATETAATDASTCRVRLSGIPVSAVPGG